MNRIKELRKSLNMSQYDLATELGVAQNTISQWERGAREVDNSNLIKIAGYFGVSVDYLLGRANKLVTTNNQHSAIDDEAIKIISEAVANSHIADEMKDMNDEEREAYTKAFIQYMDDNAKYIKLLAKQHLDE